MNQINVRNQGHLDQRWSDVEVTTNGWLRVSTVGVHSWQGSTCESWPQAKLCSCIWPIRVKYWVVSHNPAQTSSGSMFQLWISDGFEWSFAVNCPVPKICCPPSIQSTHTHACHNEVFDQIFWVRGLHCHLLRHLAKVGPMFLCNKSHEAMNTCRDWVFSHSWVRKWGCQPFSCRCSQNVRHRDVRKMWGTAERRFVRHVCLMNPCLCEI